jgi:hypothetical protein
MKFHYDWEYKENGSTIEPISLGMVDDNGRELYIIYGPAVRAFREREYFNKLDQTDLWLLNNVFNHISESDLDNYACWDKQSMAECVYDFITDDLKAGDRVELWGYFAAYDHVCLSQLFGRMIDLPAPIPLYTNELMTIRNRRSLPNRPADLPEHHSLMDAKYQKMIYDVWSKNVPN